MISESADFAALDLKLEGLNRWTLYDNLRGATRTEAYED
jgi:hypothetical protein